MKWKIDDVILSKKCQITRGQKSIVLTWEAFKSDQSQPRGTLERGRGYHVTPSSDGRESESRSSESERGNPVRFQSSRVAVIGHFQMLLTLKLSTFDT